MQISIFFSAQVLVNLLELRWAPRKLRNKRLNEGLNHSSLGMITCVNSQFSLIKGICTGPTTTTKKPKMGKKLIKCGWWKSNDKIKSNAKVAYYSQPAKEGAKVDKGLGVFFAFLFKGKKCAGTATECSVSCNIFMLMTWWRTLC